MKYRGLHGVRSRDSLWRAERFTLTGDVSRFVMFRHRLFPTDGDLLATNVIKINRPYRSRKTLMADSPAEQLCRLNVQAIALLRLGMPLDMGLDDDGDAARTIEKLTKINEFLEGSTGDRRSVDSLLEQSWIPESYRELAALLLETTEPAPILKSSVLNRPDFRGANQSIRRSLTQPFLIMALTLVGIAFLCVHVLPKIEANYAQNFTEPSGATAWLLSVKAWLPVWIVVIPAIGILFWFYAGRHAAQIWYRLMPGTERYNHWLKSASDAARLSATVDLPDHDQTSALDDDASNNPIIRRIVASSDHPDRSAALGKLSRFYQDLAASRGRQIFGQFTAYAGLLLAGFAVLAYGLATFLPWIEILSNLSNEAQPR